MKLFLLVVVSFYFSFSIYAQSSINKIDENGLKQGPWTVKFENGRLKYKGNFIDDKPVGEMFRFHDNGKIKARLNYNSENDSVYTKLFSPKGKQIAEGIFFLGKKEGAWSYFRNGKLFVKENYIHGVLEGQHALYTSSGVQIAGMYIQGKKEGIWTEYFHGGTKKLEVTFVGGVKEGPCLGYFESGSLSVEGVYLGDKRDGDWRMYSDNNIEKATLIYENGFLKNPTVLSEIQIESLKEFESNKMNIKDPADFIHNPEGYLR